MTAEQDRAAVRLSGVTRQFDGKAALADVDLEVPARRTMALIGPSGCGKSTLLRLVVGLDVPDRGTIEFEGEPLNPRTAPALRLRMGYVIQEGGLFPHLTAADNVALVARDHRWSNERIAFRTAELAELAHLPSELLAYYPAQLSGGQRQRVALMRALMLDPDVLLLDEPLGALDPMIRAALQSDLRDAFRRLSKTVLLVTHDLSEAAYLADEIVLLREGRILQRGTARDFVERPADPFVTAFLNAQRPAWLGGSGVEAAT
ncbi:MAG: ATP-binding cassette domain-containing protein [Candidatus Eiseniibacteriota bacterium]